MTRKKCKVKLWIVAVLTLIGLFFTFVSFVIPTTNTTFNGFFNAINYGYDINGGVLAVYKPSDTTGLTDYEVEKKLENTVARLNSSLNSLGLNASKQGDRVRIEISNADYVSVQNLYTNYGVDILSLIGAENGITFSTDSENFDADGFVGGEYISNCSINYGNNGYYGVEIKFNNDGKEKFKALTGKVIDGEASTLYIYFDGETSGITIDNENDYLASNRTSLTLYYQNEQVANAVCMEINALAKPINLTQVSSSIVSSGLNTSVGNFLGNAKILILVASLVAFVGACILLCARYKVLGLLALMANLIWVVVYSFLLQSIPLVLIDVNGLIGVLFVFVLLLAGEVCVFEKIKSEYALGKKIPNSVKSGFKKNVLSVLEKYVFVLIFAVVLFIVGSSALKSFAVSAFIGLFVNYLVLFAVLNGICALYIVVNPTKKSSYNLKREAVKHEI